MTALTEARQQARNDWAVRLKDAWPSLDRHVRHHCLSEVNLDRWWPGTFSTSVEAELRGRS